MYSIGDKVVYPMHGAGLIEDIKDGEKGREGNIESRYYVLAICNDDMKIMVQTEKAVEIGIRPVFEPEKIEDIKLVLSAPSSEMPENWNKRYRENLVKLQSGDVRNVAEVVRNLYRVDTEKKLSSGERKLLGNAMRILMSEIKLSLEISEEVAKGLIEGAIGAAKKLNA